MELLWTLLLKLDLVQWNAFAGNCERQLWVLPAWLTLPLFLVIALRFYYGYVCLPIGCSLWDCGSRSRTSRKGESTGLMLSQSNALSLEFDCKHSGIHSIQSNNCPNWSSACSWLPETQICLGSCSFQRPISEVFHFHSIPYSANNSFSLKLELLFVAHNQIPSGCSIPQCGHIAGRALSAAPVHFTVGSEFLGMPLSSFIWNWSCLISRSEGS